MVHGVIVLDCHSSEFWDERNVLFLSILVSFRIDIISLCVCVYLTILNLFSHISIV